MTQASLPLYKPWKPNHVCDHSVLGMLHNYTHPIGLVMWAAALQSPYEVQTMLQSQPLQKLSELKELPGLQLKITQEQKRM